MSSRIHDLGGMYGLGPVVREVDEPVFHADWERQIFAIHVAIAGEGYNLDEFRHGIELMQPAHYLTSSYYEHWLATIQYNLLKSGRIDAERLSELTKQVAAQADFQLDDREDPELTQRLLAGIQQGAWTDEASGSPPRFGVGARVLTINRNPSHATRLPQYARSKEGVIRRVYPSLILPDTNAHREGSNPQWVYNVEFAASELWGVDAEPGNVLYLDLWESYLTPADDGSPSEEDERE